MACRECGSHEVHEGRALCLSCLVTDLAWEALDAYPVGTLYEAIERLTASDWSIAGEGIAQAMGDRAERIAEEWWATRRGLRLRPDADTDEIDGLALAERWYGAYGAHVSTERQGDIDIQAITPAELIDLDRGFVSTRPWTRRLAQRLDIAVGEADALRILAERIWAVANEVAEKLMEAVTAHEDGDLENCLAALDKAARLEARHGAPTATDALRAQLIEEGGAGCS